MCYVWNHEFVFCTPSIKNSKTVKSKVHPKGQKAMSREWIRACLLAKDLGHTEFWREFSKEKSFPVGRALLWAPTFFGTFMGLPWKRKQVTTQAHSLP